MRGRRGFTLIEVIVALLLAGVIAVGVRRVFAAIGDSSGRITAAGQALDRAANGDRLIRAVVASADLSEGRRLFGDRDSVTFAAWCMTPRGWLDVRDVRIQLRESAGAKDVAIVIDGLDSLTIRATGADAELAYLNDFDAGGQWTSQWTSPVSLPRAIGILSAKDTVILRIGDRG